MHTIVNGDVCMQDRVLTDCYVFANAAIISNRTSGGNARVFTDTRIRPYKAVACDCGRQGDGGCGVNRRGRVFSGEERFHCTSKCPAWMLHTDQGPGTSSLERGRHQ